MMHEGIAGIVESALAYHAETLAGGTPENDVNPPISYPRLFANVPAIDIANTSAD